MNSTSSAKIIRPQHAALVLLICFFMSLSAMWVHLNQGPPSWDDAWYLDDSLQMYDGLTNFGPRGWLDYYLHHTQARFKAPLICALPTPIYLLTGRDYHHALYLNVLLMPFLLIAVYAIARKYASPRAALLALFICATLPQLFGLATWFMVEYGLAVFTALAIACLIYSDDFSKTRWVALFSAICGLGMLQKIFFPVFVAPPALYILIRCIRRSRQKQPGMPSAPRTIAALLLPILLIAGPWYCVNGKNAVQRALFSGYDKLEAGFHSTGEPFSLPAISKYLLSIAYQGVGLPYAVGAILVLIILAATRKTRPPHPDRAPRPSFRTIAILWSLSFLVFLFGRNKLLRFIAPLLPLFAICFAFMLDRLLTSSPRWGRPLTAAILAVALLWQIQTYFQPLGPLGISLPDDPNVWRTNRALMTAEIAPRVYESRPWPLQQMLISLPRPPSYPAKRLNVMLGNDSFHFNYFNVALTVTQMNVPITVRTTAYYPDPDQMRADLSRTDYFLFRNDAELPAGAYNTLADAALRQVTDPTHWQLSKSPLTFPDHGTLTIYHNLHPDPK